MTSATQRWQMTVAAIAIFAITSTTAFGTNAVWKANAVGNFHDDAGGNANWVSPAGWDPDALLKDYSGTITGTGNDGQADGVDTITYEAGSFGATNTLNIEYYRPYNQISVTIPADNTFIVNANVSMLGTSTNAGLLQINADKALAKGTATIVNTGTIRVYGKIYCSIINSNGLVELMSNTANYGPEPLAITGGTFIQAGTVDFYGEGAHERKITLANVAATNSGTLYIRSVANSSKGICTLLSGTTTLENSGIIRMENNSSSSSGGTTYFQVDAAAKLTTTAASQIYITQTNNTSGTYIHNAWLNLDASATPFTNNGLIEISSLTDSRGTAQLRSSRGLANNGTITVAGEKSSVILNGGTFVNAGTLNILPDSKVVFTNSAALNNDAGTLAYTLGAGTTQTPEIQVYGSVTLSGTLSVDVLPSYDGTATSRYDVITCTGIITDNGLTLVNATGGKFGIIDNGTTDGTVTIGIPPPTGTLISIR